MRWRAVFFLLGIGRCIFAFEWVEWSGIISGCFSLLRIWDGNGLGRLRLIYFDVEVGIGTVEKKIVVRIVVVVLKST